MQVKTISLLGHKDHGKSTLIGSILMETGAATQVRINEAKEYSKRLGKAFEPAFILDSFAEEREQEMTYDTTRAQIKYKKLAFAFIDVPGHEELIKNMISGASYGEIALLLVSAKKDEGIRDQTKRHLFISRMLGIKKLVVAVNKMDTCGYDQSRFESIIDGLQEFIGRIGFAKENVKFVPVSAYNGENLVKKSKKMSWYKGKTLLELIYEGSEDHDSSGKGPLRLLLQGFLEGRNDLLVGKVIRGKLNSGKTARILPSGTSVKIKEITVKGRRVKTAKAGENVAVLLEKKVTEDVRGSVVCENASEVRPESTIKAKVFVVLSFGEKPNIKFNGNDVPCKSVNVLKYVDTTNGSESTRGKIEPLNAIIAQFKLERKIPAESYDETKELGRFVLYSKGKFAGIGVIE